MKDHLVYKRKNRRYLIKNRDSFCEKVKPAIQKSKEKIVKNLPEDYQKYFE